MKIFKLSVVALAALPSLVVGGEQLRIRSLVFRDDPVSAEQHERRLPGGADLVASARAAGRDCTTQSTSATSEITICAQPRPRAALPRGGDATLQAFVATHQRFADALNVGHVDNAQYTTRLNDALLLSKSVEIARGFAMTAKEKIDEIANTVATRFGGKTALVDPKTVESITGKLTTRDVGGAKYNQNVAALKDIARNTIIMKNEVTMRQAANLVHQLARQINIGLPKATRDRLRANTLKNLSDAVKAAKAIRPKNAKKIREAEQAKHAFQNPSIKDEIFIKVKSPAEYLGYSDMTFQVPIPVDATGTAVLYSEIQINTPQMIWAKSKESTARKIMGDAYYTKLNKRISAAMPAGLKKAGQGHVFYDELRVMTDKTSTAYLDLKAKSERYYAAARAVNVDSISW